MRWNRLCSKGIKNRNSQMGKEYYKYQNYNKK